MGSHIIDILRQGIWASLTGGWFYDPHLSIFINTFHLYLWMFLLAFPLILHLTLPATLLTWAVYCGVIGGLFFCVKFLNYKLHHMFDTSEVIEEGAEDKDSKKGGSSTGPIELGSQEPPETFELTTLTSSDKVDGQSESKPDDQSSNNTDLKHGSDTGVKKRKQKKYDSSKAPIAEMDKDEFDSPLQGAVGGTNRPIPCCPSNSDPEEDDTPSDADDDLSIPNTITTKADVEAEPMNFHTSLPDESLQQLDLKSPTDSKHSGDADLSDVSPEHVSTNRPKKSRRKTQRAKSALESSNYPSKHSSERSLRSRPSLPARPKLQSVINKDTGVCIIRPWSDQTISRTKQMLESDEITVIDFEVMNNVAKAYQARGAGTPRRTKSKVKDSIDECSEKNGKLSESDLTDLKDERTSVDDNVQNADSCNEPSQSSQDMEVEDTTNVDSSEKSDDEAENDDETNEKVIESNKSLDDSELLEAVLDSVSASTSEGFRTRKAASEERALEKESSKPISSSQPIIKIGGSYVHSSSDESDLSLGEVVVVDKKGKKGKTKAKTKTGSSTVPKNPRARPNSAEFLQTPDQNSLSSVTDKTKPKLHSSPTLNTNDSQLSTPLKPKDIGFARVSKMLARATSDRSQSSEKVVSVPSSQQSSVVGLDWLFSTDSDSSDTRSHGPEVDSVTSSTISIDDSYLDNSLEQPVSYDLLQDTNTDSSPSSPSLDDLETMRKQGAIPKHFQKPLHPLPEPSPPKDECQDTKTSSPASFDLSDPEEFHRKLIEILNEPAETSTEQLKKFMAVMEAKKNKSSSVKSKNEKEDTKAATSSTSVEPEKSENQADNLDTKSNTSKPVTPTEITNLLPDNQEDASRGMHRRARKPVRKRRRNTGSGTGSGSKKSSHLAESHEDTTEGATHLFQDEDGNWFSYMFGESGAGVAVSIAEARDSLELYGDDHWSSSSCASVSMVVLDSLKEEEKQMAPPFPRLIDHHHDLGLPGSVDIRPPRGILQAYVDQLLENGRRFSSSSDTDSKDVNSSRDTPQTKHFYKFKMFPKKYLKVYFDRLALLALLDRNLSVIENCIAVIMSVLVGALGALVLAGDFYFDIWIFVFCFIMAGCQYSLLKSVQPDASSPMHGYNHLIVFSRPFYFCLCCGLMLLLDHIGKGSPPHTEYVYGMPFTSSAALWFARDFLKVFLLCLPLVFTAGLLPQVNTFFMYALEQIDTHVFGGNATVSLASSIYCISRSVLTAGFLYVICYLTLIQLGKTIVDEPDPCKNKEFAQTAAFSIFCAVLVALSYHLSRSASDPSVIWMLIRDKIFGEKEEAQETEQEGELKDPLPGKLKQCVSERLQSDLLISVVIMILSFAIHVSTVFIQPLIDDILYFTIAGFGFLIHYVIPQLRKEMPWLCCSHPILKSEERNMFEATSAAKIMWFEKMYIWMRFVERNGMYPVVVLCALTRSVPGVLCKFGSYFGPLVLTICSFKLLRFTFSNTPKQHMILAFTVLFFKYDLRWASETMLIDYFFIAILFMKFCDLYLKMKFVITYIAPWQITWGSAFHAFAQPFSVPHSAMLFLQAGVSAFFSTPLNPFLGSAIFITSYVRPVKFWEKDYNTKRVDHSNTRLSQQLERNTGADDNNLNSIFYEHLTRSLQHSLCGDLLMGRWGSAEQGDTFIMASDSLNALVHIIEMGNGLVTFQLRGLEFRGTYCQQREVEAITEGVEDNEGFCCCEPGHLPHFLSLNAAFNQRWLSWEVVVTKYVLEGYSISDNNAASMVGVFDFRKVLIMYYVQSIIYYTVRSPRLEQWLENTTILEALVPLGEENYCDVDPTFSVHVDDDYDSQNSGISRKSFCNKYLEWIQYCASRREKAVDSRRESPLASLCYALSLLGRRALGTASHNNASASVEFFLYGLHALFKGDFRITSSRDEWVFADMELLRRVVSPGVRMSLKLHQDHFLISDAYETEEALYDAISHYEANLVISHEADPAWRNAVLSNTPSLLALRNVFDEGSDEYKIIMLNKRYLTFRIVKVNRECVRGLWAGQQQELIFLRNRNPERGSIQNAKQALRNMINSSCDQPIGYPIYVSPLTTSYSSTNEQYTSVIGGEFIIDNVKGFFKNAWQSLRRHCGASCTSGSSAFVEGDIPYSCTHQAAAAVLGSARTCPTSTPTNAPGDLMMNSIGNRGSLISTTSSAASKPRSVVTLAALMGDNPQSKDTFVPHRVKITDISCVYNSINLGRRIDVQWPNEEWRTNGGRNSWAGWYPRVGMVGTIVHRWSPCHREVVKRSHVDKTILLVQVGDKYVPIGDQGVQDMGPEVC